MSDFSIHGLWPGNATGHTPFTCNVPPSPKTVEKVVRHHVHEPKEFLGVVLAFFGLTKTYGSMSGPSMGIAHQKSSQMFNILMGR
ncbi:hypothetical protein KY290_023995 [Solanum tuberosum]|uniref:Uncharacterized protein n=1 Tax=Solanum tuberosum TaxID=4113 RepID=A0ABQ7UPG2_SOLTU|nr:hypothetical protein KY284_022892 [Solanum tuberosum]KAH0671808.1 hypothetical protein KY284_022895 [Solanum tuberosum]KAH0671811.1 hypothetical protein KY284_022898 [Solanum tuberosum]KAH0753718.1 hypothetical protein KY290_023988 [Solanum tuberosum]KAH0753721.1 hypothetical protein KY290_023991 [Solanum tuberosum]